jgi:hypothetical protein
VAFSAGNKTLELQYSQSRPVKDKDEDMTHLLGHTKNDLPVYVDLFNLKTPTVHLECDMGRVIGYDFIVKTTSDEAVFYVQLVQDTVYTRFTKSSKPSPTQYISIVLQRNSEGPEGVSYQVDDLWLGRLVPPRPGSAEETPESKPYWEDHAFVFGNQSIQPRTLTKTRPY